jgi:hypothetical protein
MCAEADRYDRGSAAGIQAAPAPWMRRRLNAHRFYVLPASCELSSLARRSEGVPRMRMLKVAAMAVAAALALFQQANAAQAEASQVRVSKGYGIL